MRVMVINGPNLNMLGYREPAVYGDRKYTDLCAFIETISCDMGIDVLVRQSNHEGEIVDWIHELYFEHYDGLVINAGAYTHYSYAIRDALAILSCPVVEVHLSDVMNREDFRKISVIEEVCTARCFGKGFDSYKDALLFIKNAEVK
ncbi:MAG: type II 3-dehydroquinate dehydratase [Lachnospiraceae bacterium]|nr:type II 3-dehydroquinate dehydratase [Lachnospiraceae bacterium]